MSYASLHTRAQAGIKAPQVNVEVHVGNGLPMLNIVGLAETSVKESKDRVRSAIINSGFDFPSGRRVLINLSPADLPKNGGRYDLPIALGILAATSQINPDKCSKYCFAGELGLNGELRSFTGVLPFAIAAKNAGQRIILPTLSVEDLHLLVKENQQNFLLADTLAGVCNFLQNDEPLKRPEDCLNPQKSSITVPDLKHVKGQHQAKRVLEIAAAGGHNMLMSGPPGTGKTMLASCLPGILPPLENNHALEVATIYSIAGRDFSFANHGIRPFRNPHHTASGVALVGGGSNPRPGEISMAHNGVLFLDELTEYPHQVLNVLREPLESGEIRISRAMMQVEYPANFQLVAAMNPCPCGYLGTKKACGICTPDQIAKYLGKISGPLLDRIDLHIEVGELKSEELLTSPDNESTAENSEAVRQRVCVARQRQMQRQGKPNNAISAKEVEQCCQMDTKASNYLQKVFDTLQLSARAYHKILRVARTIADMYQAEIINHQHLLEAVSYRQQNKR